jgi:hypothetical protein
VTLSMHFWRFPSVVRNLILYSQKEGENYGLELCSTAYHTDAWWQASHNVKYEHCEEVDHAERTVINYWLRYCPWALEFGDWETLARTHNGGPCYWHHFSTTRYW